MIVKRAIVDRSTWPAPPARPAGSARWVGPLGRPAGAARWVGRARCRGLPMIAELGPRYSLTDFRGLGRPGGRARIQVTREMVPTGRRPGIRVSPAFRRGANRTSATSGEPAVGVDQVKRIGQ